MNVLKEQNDPKDDAKCFACVKTPNIPRCIRAPHLSLSRQKVSLRCAAAGGSSADRSGQTPSHSLGSRTGTASLLQTDPHRFKN